MQKTDHAGRDTRRPGSGAAPAGKLQSTAGELGRETPRGSVPGRAWYQRLSAQGLGEKAGLEETRNWVLENLSDIENAAAETIKSQGETYPVAASVETAYFPDKTYGDYTFPAGEYEALNIRIGKAEGKNWWCVLYPSLCFIDDTWGIVSQEKKEELKEVLTEEEFQAILGNPEEKKKVRVGFKWF